MQKWAKPSRPIGSDKTKITKILLIPFLLASAFLLSTAFAQPTSETTLMAHEGTTLAIYFLIGTLAMKITAIVIGYLVVRLGHDTLVRGITGELDFGFTGSGVEAKLKSASPGAAFVLAGAAIIIWALVVDKPFNMTVGPQQAVANVEQVEQLNDGPSLPD